MIRTLDFNTFPAGTVIDDEYEGVAISATGGSDQAMVFDSANPTGGDTDLASDTLGGILIISEDGDSSDPDDAASGGSFFFDFEREVLMKSITFKDTEAPEGEGIILIFRDADGNIIEEQFVPPTGDNGEATVQLNVPGTAQLEVILPTSGAIDNVTFDDPGAVTGGENDGVVSDGDDADVIDATYTGDPDGDLIDNSDALLAGEGPQDDIVDANGGDDTVVAGEGDDEVYAGAGDDVVDGGTGDDIIYGDSTYDRDTDGPAAPAGGDGGAGTPTGANLIVNGSFEDTTGMTATGYGFVGTDGNVTGWDDANGAAIDFHSDGRGGVDASDGSNWLDLASSPAAGAIGQNVAGLTDGASYQVGFDAADAAGDDNLIGVFWGGELVDTIDPASTDMVSYTYTVVGGAGDGTDRLEFRDLTGDGDSVGGSVDNVSLFLLDGGDTGGAFGDDDLDGGAGDDIIFGEGGDDTLTGGEGADQLSGGDDQDLFVGGNAGDVVDGGTGGTDNDTLDLRDSGPLRIVGQTDDADGNSTSGTVEFLDADGNVTGTMTFAEIENILLPEVGGNTAPDAVDDADVTDFETPVTVNLLANDTDDELATVTVTAATVPAAQGTLVDNGDGTVTFTPADGFEGDATISYTITDAGGLSDSAVHTVTVAEEGNTAPDAVDDADTTDFETPVTVNLLANDTDDELATVTVTAATVPAAQGTLVDNGDGTVTFTPADGFEGDATISYTITDAGGLSDSAVHTVTVAEEGNTAPDAVDDADAGVEDTPIIVDLLANDTDNDLATVTVTAVSVPADQGTVVNNGDGTATFTPAPDFNGEATISYTIEDAEGLTDSAVHVVDLAPVNDAPVAVDDSDETEEDTPITVNLLANDSDVDGDTLSIVDATVPADQGTLVDNGDGTVTFTPAPDFNGAATITYFIEDEEGLQDSAIHTVNVGPVNDAPIANDDSDVTDEDTAVTLNLIANDSDPELGPLTVVAATVPAEQGTLVDNGDGTVTFTPAADFNGEATISYTIEDEDGLRDSAEHTVTVDAVNDAPTAVDDSDVTEEDTSVTVNLLANDSDVDGDDLSVVTASVPAEQGTLVDNGDGTVTFTPAADFTGEATISYTIEDEIGAQDSAEHTITVTPLNDAPTAVDDSDDTAEDTPITVDLLANDSDVDGDDLTVVSATVPADQGTLVDNGDGTVTFTPAPDFNGAATISYTIEDEDGLQDSAIHTVNVGAVNDAPIAVDDSDEGLEDTAVTVNLIANDSDPELSPLVVVAATVPADQGTLVDNGDGTVTFTPAPDFNGEATISYTIADEDGLRDSAEHTINVAPVNDAPDAVDDVDVTAEDTAITVDLLDNDTDVDGDDLTVTDVSVPAEQGTIVNNGDGTATFTPAPDFNGEATISYSIEDEEGLTDSAEHTVYVNEVSDAPVAVDDTETTDEDTPVTIDALDNDSDPDGDDLIISEASVPAEQGTVEIVGNELVFTPAPDFNGEATIDYVAQDPDGNEAPATVTVTVTPVNDAPVAEDDTDVTDLETPITVDLLANDSDADGDALTVTEATVPAEQGTLVDNGDGTVTFTPADDFTGEATISYTITDPDGLTDTAEHVITVNVAEDAPTAVDDAATTDEDTPVTIDVVANDTDPTDDALTITVATVPEEQGTVEIVDNQLVFTPAPDFNGEATIDYTIEDPDGNAAEAQATVTVTPVNDDPVAEDDSDTTGFETPVTVNLLDNDSDPEGDTLTVSEATVPADQGTLVDNGDGTVTFTPADGFEGDATISYTITDGNGGTDSAEHTVTVGDNGAPVTVDDTAETPEDTPVTIDLVGNDTDPNGDPLELKEATVPAEQGTLVDNGDGTVTFTPAPDFNGEVTISYVVCDPSGAEDEGTATVTVTPVNDAPVAEDDSDTTDEGTPVTVDLLANDTDVDGDPLTVTEATVPADQGTLVNNGDGTVTFTPADGFTGEATISYTVEDPDGLSDTAEHTVVVNDADDAPTAVDDIAFTDEDTPVTIGVLANDTDPTDDTLTIVSATVPEEQGTVEIVGDELVFTPAPDFNGEATITYTIEDPDGNASEAEAVVTVTPLNDAPDAVDDVAETEEDTDVVIDLVDNDSDPDGDTLSVIDVTVDPAQGTIVNNGDGTATFTPAPDFTGDATVTYTVDDGNGGIDTAEHVVTVTPVNDLPVAVDDFAETPEDTPVTIDLVGNDTDADGEPLELKEASVPAEQGTLVDNGDGTVTFTPAPDFNGTATITYVICDPEGAEATGEAVVTVTPVNDAPIAVDDTDVTAFNTPEIVELIGNDTDVDGDPLTLVSATVPADQGTLVDNGDGTVTFTPVDGFEGEATITYVVSDPDGLTDEGVAIVTVQEDPRDGIVQGTDGDDVIDFDYVGDPDGDLVDNEDALLPGTDGDDDSIVAGDGNDTVFAGEGNDTVDGGDGDDVIDTGSAGTAPDQGYPFGDDGFGFDPDTNPEDERDSVDGGAGDDTITTGDDRDTIDGGTGADVIDSGIDDDEVDGGEGDDRIVGGEGNDLIEGGDGNDTIFAGGDPDLGLDVLDIPDDGSGPLGPDRNPTNGLDTVFGGAGDDVIFGGDDDDVLDGGIGDDSLDGGIDDDSLIGGEGNDTLVGGQGNDTMEGGDDEDLFVGVTAGDVIDGGDGGVDNDTLDLTGSLPEGGTYVIDFADDTREDGVVNYFDEDGNDAGQLVFEEIENIIPCFTPGTKIATPKGERLVEELQVGDRVITRDNGIQEIRWTGARDMSGADLERASHLKPVLIRRGALGNDLPERDMMVSPNHRVLVANDKTALYFEEREVLVAAKHLTGLEGVDIVDVSHTTYIHVMFDQHEVILSDGAWTESFQPGDQTLAGIGNAQRQEILELFPELATKEGVEAYASARRSLKKHEAKLITK